MARPKNFNTDESLEKAMNIFWHKGYHGTSMQDLVDTLGLSRSSIYDTYGGKHQLFVEALKSYMAAEAIKRSNIMECAVFAKEGIKQLLVISTNTMIADEQHKGCFFVNSIIELAPHDKEVNDMIKQNDREIEDAFFRTIKKGKDNGEFNTHHDTKAMARFIFNTVKGMRVSVKSVTDKLVFDDIIRIAMLALD